MVEKMYGVGIFYEEAANQLISEKYPEAAKESGLDIVSRPEVDVIQIEKGLSSPTFMPINCSSNPGINAPDPITNS